MPGDLFGTAEVRERVLAEWSASPTRFREDANAEEDHALGGYRDRLVVELAQNAADAAVRAGTTARVLFAVHEGEGRPVLVVANTGEPLTREGVLALATLRASAKRDAATVGRFGAGFSSVLAVTDEPTVLSRSGGVRFSVSDTRALVAQAAAYSSGLAVESARRDGHVPALRLPFPADGGPPAGYDTAVVLPLRDGPALELVVRLLDEVQDALLLALPALAEVVVEIPGRARRVVADVEDRWIVHRRSGDLPAHLLAGRPTEERARATWQLAWAVPRDPASGVRPPGVLYAPTVTEEPLTWPAMLVAPFPVDPGRRHVVPGGVSSALVEEAAGAYVDLLHERARAGIAVWSLLPTGLAHGEVDGALREALRRRLPDARILLAAEQAWDAPGPVLLRPRDAVVLEPPAGDDPAALAGLAPVVAGLVAAPRSASGALTLLGLRRTALADVVEQLPAVHDPRRWRELYSALSGLLADPASAEVLAALPVPLADGRVVRGVRGLVLPTARPADRADEADALAALGVRVVDPDAVHSLLERLGAVPLAPRAALELPEVRAAVRNASEHDDLDLAAAVLDVVAAAVADAPVDPADVPWLADLPLLDADDDPAPAAALVLPESFAGRVLDPEDVAPVSDDAVDRWGRETLRAVGVLDTLGLLTARDVVLAGPGAGPAVDAEGLQPTDLDGWEDWVDEVVRRVAAACPPDGEVAPEIGLDELVAVRDLDAVLDEAWPTVLAMLATEPPLRRAALSPARVAVRRLDGTLHVDVPGYTAWWLGRALADGPWADPDADPALARLLPGAPVALAGLDPELRRALGGVRTVADLDAEAIEAVLDGMGDASVPMDAATAVRLWDDLARLADAAPIDGESVAPPMHVRVLDGAGTSVVRARDAVVVDAPMWLQRTDLGLPVLARDPATAPALADLLDVVPAPELAPGKIDDAGQPADVPEAVRALLPAAPRTWREHEELLVDEIEVAWWVDASGTVHASTLDGLARGLAWAAGAWARRAAVFQVLTDPESLATVVADEAFG